MASPDSQMQAVIQAHQAGYSGAEISQYVANATAGSPFLSMAQIMALGGLSLSAQAPGQTEQQVLSQPNNPTITNQADSWQVTAGPGSNASPGYGAAANDNSLNNTAVVPGTADTDASGAVAPWESEMHVMAPPPDSENI